MFGRELSLTTADVQESIDTPTRADPAVVMMGDRTSVACWVELVGDACHWFFASTNGRMGMGPEYRGEHSLDEIRDLVSHWCGFGTPAAHAAT